MPILACKPQSPFLYFFQNYRYESQGAMQVNVPGTPQTLSWHKAYSCCFHLLCFRHGIWHRWGPLSTPHPWSYLCFPRAAHFPTYTTKGANWSPPQDSFFLSLSFYNSTVISASFPSPSHNLILFIILFKNQYWMTTFIFHTIYSLSRTTKTGFHYSAFLKSDFQSIKHFLISLCEFWGPEWWIRNLLMSVCFYGKLLKYTQINIFELIQCFQWLSMRQVFFHFWYFFMMGTYHYQHLFKHIQLSQTQTLYTTVPPLWFSFVNYNASSAKKLIVSTVVNKTEFNFISFFF